MFQHVAVKQPFARVIGNEGDAGLFVPFNEYCVPPGRIGDRFAVSLNYPEMMPVQVHGVGKGGFIDHVDDVGFAIAFAKNS